MKISSRIRTCMAPLLLALASVSCAGDGASEKEGDEPLKLAGIVFQEDQFFRLIQFGMQHAADEAGVELLLANSAGKPDKEIQLVNTYLTRQVDAIVISPLSATASVTALKRARDSGTTVVTYNSAVNGDIAAAHIESDQRDLGRKTGQVARRYIEESLGGRAKVAVIAFKSQLPETSNGRSSGFIDEIRQLPGVEIVAEQDAWLPETAIKKVGDILTANPDLDIVWSANEGGTIGAVMAVKNAGKGGQVAVFGTDTSEQLIDFLLSGDRILHAITGQQPFAIGSRAVNTALSVLKGEPVDKTVSMEGVLLSRDDPETVSAFRAELARLMARAEE